MRMAQAALVCGLIGEEFYRVFRTVGCGAVLFERRAGRCDPLAGQ